MDTITLETPIQRGETKITEIKLRKPAAGELRGISMRSIIDLSVDSVLLLLPRISDPTLTDVECGRMDPVDIMQAAGVIASFFVPKQALEEAMSSL